MDLPNAVQFANSLSTLTKYTEDAKEGPKAFAEKREPKYQGF
jgi:1,4-dihydroxy-2-naphthoyl-CoA synthase